MSETDAEQPTLNDLIRAPRAGTSPPAPEPEPSTRPEGSADGGVGEPEDVVFEDTPHGRMRVFDLNGRTDQ